MSKLVDWEIKQLLQQKDVVFEKEPAGVDWNELHHTKKNVLNNISCNSLDICLDIESVRTYNPDTCVDKSDLTYDLNSSCKYADDDLLKLHTFWDQGNFIRFQPNTFYLASSLEYLAIPTDILCLCHGKSSIARLGLQIHFAGLVDSGFGLDKDGKPVGSRLTFEISVMGDHSVTVHRNIKFAQLTFERVARPERAYNERSESRFNNADGALPYKNNNE